MGLLSVRNLSHGYGRGPARVEAISEISFEVSSGVVALLGPNGAGKTTTIRLATGFFHPEAGEVLIEGIAATEPAARARVGYLPESNPLEAALSVSETLAFWASLRGVSPGRSREVLETFSLAEHADDLVGRLSKGFRQRLGLALAALHDPPLLVLDEPTSALDPNQVRQTREMIRSLGMRRAVLLSTHLLHEAEMIADRILLMVRGRLVADGTVEEILAKTGASSLEDAFARLTH
jgi:ABC-2 type transport system ATP-binding protein